MLIKGFKFGMLLQLAIGPMCLMVFNTSASHGFIDGLCLVAAIAVIDALYIALSCVGVAAVIGRAGVKVALKLFGGLVLILFGVNTLIGVFSLSLLPHMTLFSGKKITSLFVQGLLLTASNPLTIIFWGGVLSAQIVENRWNKAQLFAFAAGCVCSTIAFLSAIALAGSLVSNFLPLVIIRALNAAVGLALIFFGLKLMLKREKAITLA